MLDPKKQAKGGFGAHVERQREREREAAADGEAANAAGGTPAQPEQAEQVPPPAEDASAPASTSATRQPKRWH